MSLQPSTDLFNISEFPYYSKYNFLMKEEIQCLMENLPPYADYSVQVMELWFNANKDLEVSNVGGNLLLKFTDLLDSNTLKYYFAGLTDIDNAIELISKSGHTKTLSCVPKETIECLKDRISLDIKEDRDNFEYLLSVEEQVELIGSKFGKYRRRVNTLTEQLGSSLGSKQLDLRDEKIRKELLHLHDIWETRNDPEGNEARAIQQAINRFEDLGYSSFATIVDGEIHGFSLYFVHSDSQTANISHTKSSFKYDNLFDYTVHSTAKHLHGQGIKFMNFEMDLGIPGLRMHKMGLRPVSFLEKYSVDFL